MDDYFNNDEFDDLFDDDNHDREFNEMLKHFMNKDGEDVEELIEIQRVKAINDNYRHIKQCGIDILAMRSHGKENFDKLKYTINTMLEHFEDSEEFEKCAELKNIKDELDKFDF
jgi:biotin operon repressor